MFLACIVNFLFIVFIIISLFLTTFTKDYKDQTDSMGKFAIIGKKGLIYLCILYYYF